MHCRHHGLGAIAGPASLVLLPKCPLCFGAVLASAGVAVPGTLGLPLAAALLVAAWLAFVLLMTRGHVLLSAAGALAAIAGFSAIAMQIGPLLWVAIAAMTALGIVANRRCRT